MNQNDQAMHEEKRKIYQGRIPDLKQKYTEFVEREYEVLGIWFGARGGIGESVLELFETLDLLKDRIRDIHSVQIRADTWTMSSRPAMWWRDPTCRFTSRSL